MYMAENVSVSSPCSTQVNHPLNKPARAYWRFFYILTTRSSMTQKNMGHP
jgi:hypothetical protein